MRGLDGSLWVQAALTRGGTHSADRCGGREGAGACVALWAQTAPQGSWWERKSSRTGGSVQSSSGLDSSVSLLQKAQPGREEWQGGDLAGGLGARISCKENHRHLPEQDAPAYASRPGPQSTCSGHQSAWESFWGEPLCAGIPLLSIPLSPASYVLHRTSERASSGLASSSF